MLKKKIEKKTKKATPDPVMSFLSIEVSKSRAQLVSGRSASYKSAEELSVNLAVCAEHLPRTQAWE